MTYRIFKKHPVTGAYVVQAQANDVSVKGNFQSAAIEWARKYARPQDTELDLLVARFGASSIRELKHIVLRRMRPEPPPWRVVPKHELYQCLEEEID